MTYSLSDIKALPNMRMEEELVSELFEGNARVYLAKQVRNQLRQRILSELTGKPKLKLKKGNKYEYVSNG